MRSAIEYGDLGRPLGGRATPEAPPARREARRQPRCLYASGYTNARARDLKETPTGRGPTGHLTGYPNPMAHDILVTAACRELVVAPHGELELPVTCASLRHTCAAVCPSLSQMSVSGLLRLSLSQLLSGCTCVSWPSCLVARVSVGPPVWLLVHTASGIASGSATRQASRIGWLVGWLVGWLLCHLWMRGCMR